MKVTKTHLICEALVYLREPSTRIDILRHVHVMAGTRGRFRPRSNHCYFTKFGGGNGGQMSLVTRGYIEISRKRGNTLFYGLTVKGAEKAIEYENYVDAITCTPVTGS